MIYVFAKALIGWLLWLVWRPKVYNKSALSIKGGAIFMCNHVSGWDPILLAVISPRQVHYMAKSSLFKGPLAKAFFRGLGAFPVNRNEGDVASVKTSLKLLKDGKVMGIFPEGTRNRSGGVMPFQKGAALLAERSGKPVVPIYIYPRSYKRERVLVAVGDAMIFAKREDGVTLDDMAEQMRLSVLQLRNKIPEAAGDEEADYSQA